VRFYAHSCGVNADLFPYEVYLEDHLFDRREEEFLSILAVHHVYVVRAGFEDAGQLTDEVPA
jgi:hypothetical protein